MEGFSFSFLFSVAFAFNFNKKKNTSSLLLFLSTRRQVDNSSEPLDEDDYWEMMQQLEAFGEPVAMDVIERESKRKKNTEYEEMRSRDCSTSRNALPVFALIHSAISALLSSPSRRCTACRDATSK